MLTAISTSTPMEIDSISSPRGSPHSKSPRSLKALTKAKLRKRKQQWRCPDLTVVSKQNGSVKLINRHFPHDENCDDSM